MRWHSTPLPGPECAAAAPADPRTAPAAPATRRAGHREQVERRRQPPRRGPARPMRRRDLADLARDDRQAPAVERAAERERNLASPYQLSSITLASSPASSSAVASPAACAAGMKHDVAILGCGIGRRELDAQRARQRGARRIDVDQGDLGARQAARTGTQRARRRHRRRSLRCGRRDRARRPRPR